MKSPRIARILADNDWSESESLKYDGYIFLNHVIKVNVKEDGSLYCFETETPLA